MNNPNPLLPQGSFLEQSKSKGKPNLMIAIFTIVAIHVVFFTGMLMQGCKRENKEPGTQAQIETNTLPPIDTNTIAPVASNAPPVAVPSTNAAVVPPPVVAPPPETAPATKEYTIAKGDSFYSIAKANGVPMSAVAKANPGVDSRHLKVGQKIQLPAGAETAAAHAEASGAETAAVTYTVKAGDTLARIAKHHGTTVKAIKAANNLKSDHIKAGQKLKVPSAKAAAPAATEPVPTPLPTNPPAPVPANPNPAPAPRV